MLFHPAVATFWMIMATNFHLVGLVNSLSKVIPTSWATYGMAKSVALSTDGVVA
jgi:hypothetical protein